MLTEFITLIWIPDQKVVSRGGNGKREHQLMSSQVALETREEEAKSTLVIVTFTICKVQGSEKLMTLQVPHVIEHRNSFSQLNPFICLPVPPLFLLSSHYVQHCPLEMPTNSPPRDKKESVNCSAIPHTIFFFLIYGMCPLKLNNANCSLTLCFNSSPTIAIKIFHSFPTGTTAGKAF